MEASPGFRLLLRFKEIAWALSAGSVAPGSGFAEVLTGPSTAWRPFSFWLVRVVGAGQVKTGGRARQNYICSLSCGLEVTWRRQPGQGSLSCARSGFLEAEVGPVHSNFLTSLLCRIQTEPLEVLHLSVCLIHLHPIQVFGQEHIVQGGG